MKNGLTLLFALGVAAVGGPGCAGGGDGNSCSDFPSQPFLTQTSDAGDLQIALRSCPDQPPVQGVDNIQYTITDSAGEPQDGLTLSIVPWMPSMGHGSNSPAITANGEGNYVATDVYLFMAGSWALETTIKGPETNDSVAPAFDIRSPLAAALVGALLAWSGSALGQACCAGGSAITPARLQLHEDYAIGLETHATVITGAFVGTDYFPNEPGSNEVDLEEDLLATARFLERGQVSLDVPFLATYRTDTGISDFGGGVGDINLGARWDFITAAESLHIPGIAVLLGVTVPTGRPADAPSASALAANATGIGAFQLTGGVALEKIVGTHLLLDLTGLVSQRLPRTVQEGGQTIQETLGLQLFAIAAVGWAFDSGIGVAIAGTFTGELDAVLNGVRVPQSGRSLTTISLSGSLPLGDDWRLQGSLFDDPQISGLGANQPIGTGLTFTVLRTWS